MSIELGDGFLRSAFMVTEIARGFIGGGGKAPVTDFNTINRAGAIEHVFEIDNSRRPDLLPQVCLTQAGFTHFFDVGIDKGTGDVWVVDKNNRPVQPLLLTADGYWVLGMLRVSLVEDVKSNPPPGGGLKKLGASGYIVHCLNESGEPKETGAGSGYGRLRWGNYEPPARR